MRMVEAKAFRWGRLSMVPFSNWQVGSPEFQVFCFQLNDHRGVVVFTLAILGLGFVVALNTNRR